MKKLLIGSGTIAAGMALAASLVAFAQTATSTSPATPARTMPMMLQVGPEGRVLLRGTIDAVSSNSLRVKSWGGDWSVNVGSGAKVLPAAIGNDLSLFKQGDFVAVQGTVSQSANWTIDATLVRDWTSRQMVNQEERENVQSAREAIRSGASRNFQGSASAVSGSSFTLTNAEGTTFTVNVASGAEIVNRNWLTIPLSTIQNGNNVRVWGANASGTIAAKIVRDISLPAKTQH